MPRRTTKRFWELAFLVWLHGLSSIPAQSTAFTYQGRLQDAGAPANGNFDFKFEFFDSVTNGNGLGIPSFHEDVPVTNGLFSVVLDPSPAVLDGNPCWLAVGVRAGTNTGNYVQLNPRQPLGSTPYAFRAATFNGAIALNQLPATVARLDGSNQVFTGAVQFSNPSNQFSGQFIGNGGGLTNVTIATNPTPDVGQLLHFPLWLEFSNNYPITILTVGDSVAAAPADFVSDLVVKLGNRFGLNGWWAESFLGTEAWPTNLGSAETRFTDTNWIGNYHVLKAPGDGVAYGGVTQPNGPLSNFLEVYWIQHPGGGEFDAQIMSGGSGTWTTVRRLTGYAPTRRGAYTNLSIPFNFTKPRLINVGQATNYIITAAPYLNSLQGIRYASIARSGMTPIGFTNVDAAIRDVILTNMRPALVIFHNRETPTADQGGGMQEVNRWLKLAQTSADVIYVGGYWWGPNREATLAENIFTYTNAVANDFLYFDTRTPSVSWDYLLTNRLANSLIDPHPTTAGKAWLVDLFEQRFGMTSLYLGTRRQPLSSLYVHSAGTSSPARITGGSPCGSWATYLGGYCGVSAFWFGGGDGDIVNSALAGNQNATILNSPNSNGGPQFSQGYYNTVGTFLSNGKLLANYGFVGDGSTVTNLVTMTANSSAAAAFNASGRSETIFNSNAASLPSLTLTLPASSSPGQIVRYVTAGSVTSITVNGTVLIGSAVTSLPANGSVAWQAANSSGQWLRTQ